MSELELRSDVQDALRDKYQAEARQAEVEAEKSEFTLRNMQDSQAWKDAADVEHHIFRLSGVIDDSMALIAGEHFRRWSRLDPGCDMTLVLNSPGGYLYPGMELFDEIAALRNDGHTVTIRARGYVASMAAILMQAASPGCRVMGPEASMLIHKPSAVFEGDLDSIEDAEKALKVINDRVLDIFARRCADSGVPRPFTRTQLRAGYHRKNWTLTSDEALNGGLIDVIA